MDIPTQLHSERIATLTAEVARQKYTYDPATGYFCHKTRGRLSPEGAISHEGRGYKVSIVAFMMAHNAPYPEFGVGFRDGNKTNLKPENLYAYTKEEQPSRHGHKEVTGLIKHRRQA